MNEKSWILIDEVSGMVQAEILGGLLEANGIEVLLSQEGAGRAMGLSVSALGSVEILVPSDVADDARMLLSAYYSGELEIGNGDAT